MKNSEKEKNKVFRFNRVIRLICILSMLFLTQCTHRIWKEHRGGHVPREVRTHNIEKVVNLIPESMSGEEDQDAEPSVAVNPMDINNIAISSLSRGETVILTSPADTYCLGPYFYSVDEGNTWDCTVNIPLDITFQKQAEKIPRFNDINIAYGKKVGNFYTGVLTYRYPFIKNLQFYNTDIAMTTPFNLLLDTDSIDYPILNSSAEPAAENFFFSMEDDKASQSLNRSATGQSAFVIKGTSISATAFKLDTTCLEKRTTGVAAARSFIDPAGRDGSDGCTSANNNGVTYAAFSSWHSIKPCIGCRNNNLAVKADIILCRDDAFGNNHFNALSDPDGFIGKKVAQNIEFPTDSILLGQQKVSGHLAVASNPLKSENVYVAYGKWQFDTGGTEQYGDYDLILAMSQDAGNTWTDSLHVVRNAINPSLSVNDLGELAFSYQKYISLSDKWETHVELATDGINFTKDFILCNQPDSSTDITSQPFLSDYGSMTASGHDFYGTFSAPNIPDVSLFPSGVKFQRKADFAAKKLENTDGSLLDNVSIDPYFFKLNTDIKTVANLNLCDRIPDICAFIETLRERWILRCLAGCPDFSIFHLDIHKFFEDASPERIKRFNKLMDRKEIFFENILIKDFKAADWWFEIYDQQQRPVRFQLTETPNGAVITYKINPLLQPHPFFTFYIATALEKTPENVSFDVNVVHSKKPVRKFK